MSSIRDLDWEDVKTFAEVAGARTVRSAAKSLGVHHSTVSRRIERLEENTGVRLFDRRPEGYALTEAGEDLVAVARSFADELNEVERQIAGRDNVLTGKISATMSEPIASIAFGPRLVEFTERYPGLDLEIIVTHDFLDVARREADVAIRMDNNPPQSLVGKRVFQYHSTIYATPAYLDTHDLINNPDDGRWIGWDDADGLYPGWTQDTEFARVPAWGAFLDLRLQLSAAKAGLGLAMLPCFIADREEKLVRATDRKPFPSRDVWILTHSDLRRTARVRAFMEFAEQVLRSHKKEFIGDLEGLHQKKPHRERV